MRNLLLIFLLGLCCIVTCTHLGARKHGHLNKKPTPITKREDSTANEVLNELEECDNEYDVEGTFDKRGKMKKIGKKAKKKAKKIGKNGKKKAKKIGKKGKKFIGKGKKKLSKVLIPLTLRTFKTAPQSLLKRHLKDGNNMCGPISKEEMKQAAGDLIEILHNVNDHFAYGAEKIKEFFEADPKPDEIEELIECMVEKLHAIHHCEKDKFFNFLISFMRFYMFNHKKCEPIEENMIGHDKCTNDAMEDIMKVLHSYDEENAQCQSVANLEDHTVDEFSNALVSEAQCFADTIDGIVSYVEDLSEPETTEDVVDCISDVLEKVIQFGHEVVAFVQSLDVAEECLLDDMNKLENLKIGTKI